MTEPCPHCVGLCCRDYEANCRTTHRAAQFWEHMCHYCTEGKSLEPTRTALDERADVIAYLREHDGESYDFADDFEKGDHVGWSKRVKP